MKVLKFGGTSVGTTASLTNVKKIIESIKDDAIVVVSALGGLTDKLIQTANLAASNNSDYLKEMEAICQRHFNIIGDVVIPNKKENVKKIIEDLLQQLARIYDGIFLIKDLPQRTLDNILSFGERMSSVIVANMIENARLKNSLEFIKTEKWFDKNIADVQLTNELIKQTFSDAYNGITIAPGFISTDRDTNEITNLGRGGSDFTAALIAAALNAKELEIWTDVDGFMTSDPRLISDAKVLATMSFVESMELCSYGAKVIYPPTIYPVFHKNIPIKILNTFNPDAPGTFISDSQSNEVAVKGISALKNIGLIGLIGEFTENVAEINSRSYNAMARQGINVYLVSQPGEIPTFTFAINGNDSEKALKSLQEEFAPELNSGLLEAVNLKKDMALIAVVGDNIRKLKGITARISNTLSRNNINVIASSTSTSNTTLLLIVKEEKCNDAIKSIHALFFE